MLLALSIGGALARAISLRQETLRRAEIERDECLARQGVVQRYLDPWIKGWMQQTAKKCGVDYKSKYLNNEYLEHCLVFGKLHIGGADVDPVRVEFAVMVHWDDTGGAITFAAKTPMNNVSNNVRNGHVGSAKTSNDGRGVQKSSLNFEVFSSATNGGGISCAEGAWHFSVAVDVDRLTQESVAAYLDAVFAGFYDKWADWRLVQSPAPTTRSFDGDDEIIEINKYKHGTSLDFFATISESFPDVHGSNDTIG